MKKILLLGLIVLSVMLVNSQAFAITGPCSGCHTMHNSQNGAVVNTNPLYVNGAPYLLTGDCYACHSINGTAGIVPKIDDGANLRASGTLDPTIADTDAKMHNIAYFGAGVDGALGATPPGNGGTALAGPLTCAGTVGCHGDRAVDTSAATDGGFSAMTGFHHGSVANGPGYRFLKIAAATPVAGVGSLDWELGGATAANHNVYQGSATGNGASTNSVSLLCAQCHGSFHGTANTGSGSPFNRHPVDWALTTGAVGQNSDMVTNADVHYEENPFAFGSVAGMTSTQVYTTTGAQVFCLSCHRAHGSGEPDLLRFNYGLMVAGASPGAADGTGCLGCHYTQR